MRRAMLALLFCLVPMAATAAQLESVTLYGAFRWHEWREQYSDGAGNPASLKEQGPLFGLGVTVPLDLLPQPTANGTLTLRSSGELFGGEVSYDGHLQDVQTGNLTPYSTDVVYFGVQGTTDLGWRFPLQPLTIQPFAGLGARWWLRDLQGDGGYAEYWLTLSSRLGGRLTWELADGLTLSATGGALLPFYTTNTANGTTVKPEGDWSGFGEISFATGRWEHSCFYEGLRYEKSPVAATGRTIIINGSPRPERILQPPSQSDIFGYRLGYRF